MKKIYTQLLYSISYLCISLTTFSQTTLQPFTGCPGTSVIISRPGNNSATGPYQIYLVTPETGAITPSGNPINLQINGFGLNSMDGFLYGMHESSNVTNPFFTRVDRNGAFEDLGVIQAPPSNVPSTMSVVNTAGGAIDEVGNYYFTATTFNLQNTNEVPHIFVGKILNVASLAAGTSPLNVIYREIALGDCADELAALIMNPATGAFQDIAFSPANGHLYTFLPSAGKMVHFNPNSVPTFICIDPATPNPTTIDLAGTFFDPTGTWLYILTTDGNYYKGHIGTGQISLVTHTTLPLEGNTLRGDMASCVGKPVGTPRSLTRFDNCPGASVIISRPGTNATSGPYQIYTVVPSTGAVTPTGNPINLQINGFGLNGLDGFLYGMHESSNTTNPFLTRVDRNGAFEDVGVLLPPPTTSPSIGIINTAGGTIDAQGTYYFTAITLNPQDPTQLPHIFVGKVLNVAALPAGTNPINIIYVEIALGSCADELAPLLTNPSIGGLQDFAFNSANGQIYSFLPSAGKMLRFNPNSAPTFICIDPPTPNPTTADLAGAFFNNGSGTLYLLTTDGKYYSGSVGTGVVSLITQTTLPLISGNLRGDMAACIGGPAVVATPTKFDNCPGASVIVSRPGTNATVSPYQIYTVDPPTGNITATGNPINLQINGFGLNSKDGFLYAIHESSNVTDPFFTRVGKNGITVDLGRLSTPPVTGTLVGTINTAGGTMDGADHFYFTATTADPANFAATVKLFLGRIDNVSTLTPGSTIAINYLQVGLGNCMDEIAVQLANPGNGLLQDFAFNPNNNRIYTYIPAQAGSPTPGKIAWFSVNSPSVMNCIDPPQANPSLFDLAGMFFGPQNSLYILTTDGKYFSANIFTGVITQVTQTQLPLINGNLRGDMASCVPKIKDYYHHHEEGHGDDDDDDDDDQGENHDGHHACHMFVTPNPAMGRDLICGVEIDQNIQVEMIVIDAYSRIAQRRRVQLFSGRNQLSVDISQLPKGFSSIVLVFPTGRRESIKFIRL